MGYPEYIIIGAVVVLLFGAKRLPELGKSIGEGIREFRKSTQVALEEDDKSQPEKSDKSAKP